MINVFYWPRDQRLVMTGHAEHKGNYSPVVCGAASALFYALCTTSNGFLKYKWLKGRYHLDEKGMAYCKMWPKKRYFKRTRVAIGMCVGGLMMLADTVPPSVAASPPSVTRTPIRFACASCENTFPVIICTCILLSIIQRFPPLLLERQLLHSFCENSVAR